MRLGEGRFTAVVAGKAELAGARGQEGRVLGHAGQSVFGRATLHAVEAHLVAFSIQRGYIEIQIEDEHGAHPRPMRVGILIGADEIRGLLVVRDNLPLASLPGRIV